MDPEQAYYRVHARLSTLLARLLTPRIRTLLEYACLFYAVALLIMLVIMHHTFVGQPACAAVFEAPEIMEAQLIDIKVTGKWSQIAEDFLMELQQRTSRLENEQLRWKEMIDRLMSHLLETKLLAGGRIAKDEIGQQHSVTGNNKEDPTNDKQTSTTSSAGGCAHDADGMPSTCKVADGSSSESYSKAAVQGRASVHSGAISGMGRGPLGMALYHIRSWTTMLSSWIERLFLQAVLRTVWQQWREGREAPHKLLPAGNLTSGESSPAFSKRTEEALRLLGQEMGDPVYAYSTEKGYFMLSDTAKEQHAVRIANVSIPRDHACFGTWWHKMMIDLVGYDTILINSLLTSRRRGYMCNLQTKELYNLNYSQEPNEVFGITEFIIFKFGIVTTSLFVFFTTTMSVSFTLRETQSRMLRFTVQLQHHARHQLPTFRLIFMHVVESLVFVPIMIGILFFLFEFFDDQLLAFLVMTLVWLCELFTMISVRTRLSMLFFPGFFFLYFMLFHVYFFSFTYGFSYLAFFTTAAFMQHSVLYFWNRLEVPALAAVLQRRTMQQETFHSAASSTLGILSALAASAARPPSMTTGIGQGAALQEGSLRGTFMLAPTNRPSGNDSELRPQSQMTAEMHIPTVPLVVLASPDPSPSTSVGSPGVPPPAQAPPPGTRDADVAAGLPVPAGTVSGTAGSESTASMGVVSSGSIRRDTGRFLHRTLNSRTSVLKTLWAASSREGRMTRTPDLTSRAAQIGRPGSDGDVGRGNVFVEGGMDGSERNQALMTEGGTAASLEQLSRSQSTGDVQEAANAGWRPGSVGAPQFMNVETSAETRMQSSETREVSMRGSWRADLISLIPFSRSWRSRSVDGSSLRH